MGIPIRLWNKISFAICITNISGPILAKSNIDQCPREIVTRQEATGKNGNWVASNEKMTYPLVSIRFSDGAPADIAWLVPDVRRGKSEQIWNFAPSERRFWVSCGYNNTSIILSQMLPKAVKSCNVKFDISTLPPLALGYSCR